MLENPGAIMKGAGKSLPVGDMMKNASKSMKNRFARLAEKDIVGSVKAAAHKVANAAKSAAK
jgi:hypothetical protein